jgi:hypothetical protein
MREWTLLPDSGEVVVDQLRVCGRGQLIMVLRPARAGSRCPLCHLFSRRVHSWYRHRLEDLPWEGIPVGIELHARRFFCDNATCSQRIFTERLSQTAPRYARRTGRLSIALQQITWALGGAAGSRLAQQLGNPGQWLDSAAAIALHGRGGLWFSSAGVGHRRLGVAEGASLRNDFLRLGEWRGSRSAA